MNYVIECPYCGEKEFLFVQSIAETNQHPYYCWVRCDNCGAQGPIVTGDKTAEDAWNSRPEVYILEQQINYEKQKIKHLCTEVTYWRNLYFETFGSLPKLPKNLYAIVAKLKKDIR